ncbi:hypothetical protein [Bradyrhizobium zhanjiangense]|uniref:Uncharacterized protein n=1 Tax=Bradyrhizobium zhanjiangense TaxID=1325107 RepID=A0ABY0DN38_9BRAD|nr:hypothetical protein [Bradyrhizobium zhanjiangense]RXG96366.1 hypothetical protein EAS62_12300 [Bradyrhizobium zhanjiangense]
MATREEEMWQVKTGAAALIACLVREEQSDPLFEERFLANLIGPTTTSGTIAPITRMALLSSHARCSPALS